MIRVVGIALALSVLTGASLQGQPGSRDADRGPIESLIALRSEMALTQTQVDQLTEIDRDLESRNEPLVTRVVQLRRAIRALGPRREFTAEQRTQYEALVAEVRPLMRQIDDNNEAAMRQIGAVLTEAQRHQLREILRNRDDDDDRDRRRRNG